MPPGSEDSYERVARHVREHEPDPYRRIKALHDWIADRVSYDAEALADKNPCSRCALGVRFSKKCVRRLRKPARCHGQGHGGRSRRRGRRRA